MIRFTSGDILNDNADALVNNVNCVGVTGGGSHYKFRKAFLRNYEAYRKAYQRGEVVPRATCKIHQANDFFSF